MSTPTQPKPGMLLVATPELLDPNFRRTVVYLVADGEDGWAGVVLNRPSETAVHNILPKWARLTTRPQAVYIGGPVQTNAAMCIGVCKPGADPAAVAGVRAVVAPVALVDLDADPEELAGSLRGARIYAGHAGWGADQLPQEIAVGAWRVLPSVPDDLLAGGRVDLWFRVQRRQPYPQSLEAYHPGDLSRN